MDKELKVSRHSFRFKHHTYLYKSNLMRSCQFILCQTKDKHQIRVKRLSNLEKILVCDREMCREHRCHWITLCRKIYWWCYSTLSPRSDCLASAICIIHEKESHFPLSLSSHPSAPFYLFLCIFLSPSLPYRRFTADSFLYFIKRNMTNDSFQSQAYLRI